MLLCGIEISTSPTDLHRPRALALHGPARRSHYGYDDAHSHTQDFKSATTGVAAKAMRNELNRMVQGVTDPAKKKVSSVGPIMGF